MVTAWQSGRYVGLYAPMTRLTYLNGWGVLQNQGYDAGDVRSPYRTWVGSNPVEAGGDIGIEITNVKSVSMDRSIDQDAGSCTITLFNTTGASLTSFNVGPDG
jgi:hypothetical protein